MAEIENEVINSEERDAEVNVNADILEPKELTVKVQNPRTVREQGVPKCISFQLSVENAGDVLPLGNCDHVRRTFQDFQWLRESLKQRHGHEIVPTLRQRRNLEYKVKFYYIVKQQKSLCDFTEDCLKIEELLSDPLLSLFYESDLTIGELEDFVNGKFDDNFLTEIWAKDGMTKTPEIDYWDLVTSDEYYEEKIGKQNGRKITNCL